MRVLLIGNSARAHIIAEAFAKNPQTRLFSFMSAKNPGIARLSEEFFIGKLDDVSSIVSFAEKVKPDLAFVSPELPLSVGVVDELEKVNIPSFGPHKSLARLETSKSFTRDLMQKYNIPGMPKYRYFSPSDSVEEIKDYCVSLKEFVIKQDGLAGGKGVVVMGDHFNNVDEGISICKDLMDKGEGFVIEQKLVGEEFSFHFITDGIALKPCPIAQDHKRAYVGDKGPNTGGMGAYSFPDHSLPFLFDDDLKQARIITEKMLDALYDETGLRYKGVMYGGFMKTRDGVMLIEYNARFGDPEAMNIFSLLESDFTDVCSAVVNGKLSDVEVKFSDKATVCKYVVPKGYPVDPVKGAEVDISHVSDDVLMYFASVSEEDGKIFMSSSRAIAFVGVDDDISVAEQKAESAIQKVKGEIFYRPDIGTSELIQKRISHMNSLLDVKGSDTMLDRDDADNNPKNNIIDGKKLSDSIKEDLKQKIIASGITPCLAVVLVGENPASKVYVNMKEISCRKVGIVSVKFDLPEDTTELQLLDLISQLNCDNGVHGILVQLPLPNHIDEHNVITTIDPKKDVDGFHPDNMGNLFAGLYDGLMPCTPKGVMKLIESVTDISGKDAVVVGRSNIVGNPCAKMLLDKGATITVCHSRTKDLAYHTRNADILVVAVGKARLITKDMVKPGAVVIDVGVNRVDDSSEKGYKLVGDVDFDQVKDVAGFITPVPKGVGPMTIACLMENTCKAAGISSIASLKSSVSR